MLITGGGVCVAGAEGKCQPRSPRSHVVCVHCVWWRHGDTQPGALNGTSPCLQGALL